MYFSDASINSLHLFVPYMASTGSLLDIQAYDPNSDNLGGPISGRS
jgi:hypothetical protein